MYTRRSFVVAGGIALAGLAARGMARAATPAEVQMRASARGEEVWFDPTGLWIAPGQTVRWVLHHDVHTTTAYHPANDQHSLRIPEGATPWNSGFLLKSGAYFDVRFTVEGVYDYYCLPHEEAGMVGRIVVGRPSGPGTLPFDYFEGRAGTAQWKAVPAAARHAFPTIQSIMENRIVRRSHS